MPTQTEFAKLYMYDNSPEDSGELFLTFRTNICGTGTDSNMQKIDSYLKKYDISINSAAIYNATCSFATSQYTLVLPDSVSIPTANLFSLRFISSKDFVEGETFLFDGVTYSPVNADFKSGELLLVNFDKQNRIGGVLADIATGSDSIVCKTKEDNKLYVDSIGLDSWATNKNFTTKTYVDELIGESISTLSKVVSLE